jgi:hypothetical protein
MLSHLDTIMIFLGAFFVLWVLASLHTKSMRRSELIIGDRKLPTQESGK